MKLAKNHPAGRIGFTLIELLVVITIILILIGLISAAVMKALSRGPQVVNKNTITQLSDAIGAFQTKYNVSYVPSRIILCENTNQYYNGGNPASGFISKLHQDSLEYLKTVWPRLGLLNDWNGDGALNGPWQLEGDQCLVFFLGGIPSTGGGVPGVNGFSDNPAAPAAPIVSRVGPFYDFTATQLVQIHGNLFFSCADAYAQTNNGSLVKGNVFAYFSSYKQPNGYNRYAPLTDCPSLPSSLGSGTWPYIQSTGPTGPKFFKPNSFQIISAGADFIFGSGSSNPTLILVPNGGQGLGAGKDDQCNFHDGLLGSY